ncbi:restriction endonuclease subunit S [Nocardia barduliensis]|uniref:restriction endonuclease subunit S n=1 Tax=Nocardia barduliensis TaxID=2736643 RepID=UPI00157295DA|nr:restriction endonuclease subunit S [Nocardia barduliensis]
MTDDERIPLDQLAVITAGPSGSLLDKLGDEPDGVPVVTPIDIVSWNRVDTRNLRRLSYEEGDRLDRFKLRQGDIVIVRQGSLGKLALIGQELEGALYNSSCVRVRTRDHQVTPEYLALYLSSISMQDEMLRRARGGTVPSVNAKILGGLPVVSPPLDRQHDMVSVIGDIDQLALVHRETADHLDVLKRTLLDDFLNEAR